MSLQRDVLIGETNLTAQVSVPEAVQASTTLDGKKYFIDTANRLNEIDKTLAELKKVIERPAGELDVVHIPN